MADRNQQQLDTAFVDQGWVVCPEISKRLGLDGLYSGGFAVCGVRLAGSTKQAVETWKEWQANLAEARVDRLIDEGKDLYLLVVVDRIEDALSAAVQDMLDNRQVCRKICLERNGRSLSETLNDVPFFSIPGTSAEPHLMEDEYVDTLIAGVPDEVRDDLELRSAARILEKLIAGEYTKR